VFWLVVDIEKEEGKAILAICTGNIYSTMYSITEVCSYVATALQPAAAGRGSALSPLWSPHFGYLLGCIMSIEVKA
jgi:biotin transporter BioY